MKHLLKYFPCLFLILYSCSSAQLSSKDSSKELSLETRKGFIISGDSAYFPQALAQVKRQTHISGSVKEAPEFVQKRIEIEPVNRPPKIIKFVQPNLSEEIKKSGIVGTAKVKIWIDKEGIPQLAIIVASSNTIFNEPSLVAAMNSRFTPAIMNKGPAAVWITLPYRFPK